MLIVLIVMTILRQVFKANAIYWRLSSCIRWSINSFSIMRETRKPFHLSWCVVLRCVVLYCAMLFCITLCCVALFCVVLLCAALLCWVVVVVWTGSDGCPQGKEGPTFMLLSDRRIHDTRHQITVAQKCSSPSLSHACCFLFCFL